MPRANVKMAVAENTGLFRIVRKANIVSFRIVSNTPAQSIGPPRFGAQFSRRRNRLLPLTAPAFTCLIYRMSDSLLGCPGSNAKSLAHAEKSANPRTMEFSKKPPGIKVRRSEDHPSQLQ